MLSLECAWRENWWILVKPPEVRMTKFPAYSLGVQQRLPHFISGTPGDLSCPRF
jgi:hypothetical protein